MCKCKSYNWGVGEDPEVVLDLPDWVSPGREIRKVSIDKCISGVIELLWLAGINTLSSCCGHNRVKPTIVVDDKCTAEEINRIDVLLKAIDSREWDIYQWRKELVKVND